MALVHDYLTQRGGAERVVLSMLKAFPDAPLYTSLYDPDGTYPEFRDVDIRTLGLNKIPALRGHHRLAFPFLAQAFSDAEIRADLVLCSSSGWAHGVRTDGAKVVYCHNPARWLYQTDRYVPNRLSPGRAAVALLRPSLARWDRKAARGADLYLANSSATGDRIRDVYGIEAEVLPPPPAIEWYGLQRSVDGLEPGFFLCVSRLLAYKNVDEVVESFRRMPDERLVVVGTGPQEELLRRAAPGNASFHGVVGDDELRWLYAHSAGIVAASHEDFGLTPLEAAAHGTPAAVLRWGGFLETVVEGSTGVFFDAPEADSITRAVREIRHRSWDRDALIAHARSFSEPRFIDRLRQVVDGQTEKVRATGGAREPAASERLIAA